MQWDQIKDTFVLRLSHQFKDAGYPYHLRLYFKHNVLVRTSLLDYSLASMLGELGGYFGLLLGFSLMDFGALVKQVLLSLYQSQ